MLIEIQPLPDKNFNQLRVNEIFLLMVCSWLKILKAFQISLVTSLRLFNIFNVWKFNGDSMTIKWTYKRLNHTISPSPTILKLNVCKRKVMKSIYMNLTQKSISWKFFIIFFGSLSLILAFFDVVVAIVFFSCVVMLYILLPTLKLLFWVCCVFRLSSRQSSQAREGNGKEPKNKKTSHGNKQTNQQNISNMYVCCGVDKVRRRDEDISFDIRFVLRLNWKLLLRFTASNQGERFFFHFDWKSNNNNNRTTVRNRSIEWGWGILNCYLSVWVCIEVKISSRSRTVSPEIRFFN